MTRPAPFAEVWLHPSLDAAGAPIWCGCTVLDGRRFSAVVDEVWCGSTREEVEGLAVAELARRGFTGAAVVDVSMRDCGLTGKAADCGSVNPGSNPGGHTNPTGGVSYTGERRRSVEVGRAGPSKPRTCGGEPQGVQPPQLCLDLGEAPDRIGVTGEGGSTPPPGTSPARGMPRFRSGRPAVWNSPGGRPPNLHHL